MKKYLSFLIVLSFLCSAVFAVDYVGVNSGSKRGKFSKTATPTFSQITVSSINYTYSGTVTANKLTDGTAKLTGGVITGVTAITATTGNFTNLGRALNTRAYAITGGSAITAGAISGTTGTFTGITILGGIKIGATIVTATATNVTANFSIPITVNNVLYKVLLKK